MRTTEETNEMEKSTRKCGYTNPALVQSLPCVIDEDHEGDHGDGGGCSWHGGRPPVYRFDTEDEAPTAS